MAQIFEGVSECVLNDSETLYAAKLRAKQLAEQNAREKVANSIKEFTKERNYTFSDKETATIADSVLKFTDVQYSKAIICANVTAQFDEKDILDWLSKYSQEKTALVAQNDELRRKVAELEQKLSKYETQTSQNVKIPSTNSSTKNNLDLASQKSDEAYKLLLRGDNRGAIKLYDEAIQLNPNDSWIYHNRGTAYKTLADNRGTAYKTLAEYRQAIQDFSRAIYLNPDAPTPYLYRSRCYEASGYKREAQIDLEKYKKLS